MTLSRGDHIVKLDAAGQPLTTDREIYIEYEVETLSPYYTDTDGETKVFTVLKKIR